GNNRIGFVGNMSGQPGPLELLPSAFFPAAGGGPRWNPGLDTGTAFADLFGNAAPPPGANDVNLSLGPDVRADLLAGVQGVADFQNWLGEPKVSSPPAPETWLIYGTERNTETRFEFAGSVPNPVVTAEGDGTVPVVSATALGLAADHQLSVPGLEHSTACQDE